MTRLPSSVSTVIDRLIAGLDARLPGRLEAFYLVGSIALGDYQAGLSDIDFVAVIAAGQQDIAVLAAIHAELARDYPDVHCDGIYLRPGELSAPPAATGVEAREGRVNVQSAGERHAVTWLTLADAGIALRGRVPDDCWVAADREAAIRYSRNNLETYWRNWLEARRPLTSPPGFTLLGGQAVTWGCLGIARLYVTIATGRVPSKSDAGRHALTAFPAHSKVIAEALRLRNDPAAPPRYGSRLTRRRDLIRFMDTVLASGG